MNKPKSASLIALFSLLLPFQSNAGLYSFGGGGSCPTRGAWTQMALAQTQVLADTINQLKNNPACKGIESVVGDLQAANNYLGTPKGEENRESKLESLPGELQSLRANAIQDGAADNASSTLLLNRTLEAAQISSQLNQNSSTMPTIQADLGGTQTSALHSLFNQFAAPTQKGMELVNKIFQVLPKYDECLIGQPQQGMALLGGAVKIAAAFSAAGEGVGDSLGGAISNLTTMLRDRRFTQALRKVDETEFWFSVSCLLESTSENYCEAENAQEILKYSRDQYRAAMQKNLQDRTNPQYDNPLEGYYLLVRELPMISTWLQQVQFGVTPKLSDSADFKNKIWDQVTYLTKSVNSLNGYFNEQMLFMRELRDVNAKRNQLFSIIEGLVRAMTDVDGGSGSQFFTTTVNPTLMPFYLIGMDSVPGPCRPNANGGYITPWQQWMKTGGSDGGYQSQFSDPDKLATLVEARMNEIIAGASQKSSAYFRQRLIVDMPNLVNQTLTGQYLTVRKSFENVFNYLVRFENKLKADDMDLAMIPSVRETRRKITHFLSSYDKLRTLGKNMVLAGSTENPQMSKQVTDAAKEVIDTIFDEFNLLFQKDTFLTSRLTTFIDKDFSMRIRHGFNMTPYQNDLMVITQKHLLEKLTEVHGLNPTNASLDLAQAQVVNKRNLESLEEVFKDSLYLMILQVKSVVDGKGDTGVEAQLRKKFEEEKSIARQISWSVTNAITPGAGILGWFFAGMGIKNAHPDLYQDHSNFNRVTGKDDKFGSFAQFQAKLCAQTLAFEDRGYYSDLCQGTRLQSYYGGKGGDPKMDLVYSDFMNKQAYRSYKNNPDMTRKSICALHDFNMRNTVKWMKDQDAEMLQDSTTGVR